MTNKRNEYSEEFKQQAIALVTEGGRVAAHVADELGIKKNTLYNWIANHNSPAQSQSESQLQRENKKLKKQLKQAELERDILKKAAAYFAKESV